MSEPVYTGHCLCDATRFRVSGVARNPCFCHCRSCRRASGAPFVAWATFKTSAFEVVRGQLAEHRSSREALRGFCPNCGSAIAYRHRARPEDLDVTLACLDEPERLRPAFHLWVSHKLPWVVLDDGLPQHAEWPKGDDA